MTEKLVHKKRRHTHVSKSLDKKACFPNHTQKAYVSLGMLYVLLFWFLFHIALKTILFLCCLYAFQMYKH